MARTSDYILMWDCYGLESIIDISGKRYDALAATLADKPLPIIPELQGMMLRARVNSQRNYEIYALVTDGIEESTLREMFEDDPQGSAELVRARGTKIFSDRQPTDRRVIS